MYQTIDENGVKRIAKTEEELPTEPDWANPAYPLKLERLAEIEHKQWQGWINYCIDNYLLPNRLVKKWRKNDVPYQELTEEDREKDRKYARKVLKVIDE